MYIEAMAQLLGWLIIHTHDFRLSAVMSLIGDVSIAPGLRPGFSADISGRLISTSKSDSLGSARITVNGAEVASMGRIIYVHSHKAGPVQLTKSSITTAGGRVPKRVDIMGRRVVITGLGLTTALGLEVEESWQKALAGTSGVSAIELPDTSKSPVRAAGQIKAPDWERICSEFPADAETEGERRTLFALWAAQKALADSGFSNTQGENHGWSTNRGRTVRDSE